MISGRTGRIASTSAAARKKPLSFEEPNIAGKDPLNRAIFALGGKKVTPLPARTSEVPST
jgi:hypothetical protein